MTDNFIFNLAQAYEQQQAGISPLEASVNEARRKLEESQESLHQAEDQARTMPWERRRNSGLMARMQALQATIKTREEALNKAENDLAAKIYTSKLQVQREQEERERAPIRAQFEQDETLIEQEQQKHVDAQKRAAYRRLGNTARNAF